MRSIGKSTSSKRHRICEFYFILSMSNHIDTHFVIYTQAGVLLYQWVGDHLGTLLITLLWTTAPDKRLSVTFRFAVCDNAYRSLTEENRPQCILISGETVESSPDFKRLR